MSRLSRAALLSASMLVTLTVFGASPLAANQPDAALLGVTITMTTDPNFIIDANKCSSAGPHAAYVGYRITNTSGAAITGIRATLTGISSGFGMLSNQNPEYYVGTLAHNASRYVYYLLSVPCSEGAISNLTMTVTTPADSKSLIAPIRALGANSANAGGNVAGTLLGPGAIVGQTVFMDATYTFGKVDAGDTYNVQPVGNTDFEANCLVLTSMVVTASAVPSIVVGTTDQMYFIATQSQGGSSNPVTVRYYFKYMCANVQSMAQPYATSLSGNKMKYSGNFDDGGGAGGDGGSPVIPPATNPFEIAGATTLTVAPQVLSTGGTVTYTLTLTNSSSYDATIDSLAVVLPTGVSFGALVSGGDVTVANSSEVPAPGASGRIVFRGIPNTTYYIGPTSSLELIFTAVVVSTPGTYVASGFGYAGITELSGGTATVRVGADVRTTLTGPAQSIVGTTAQYVMTTTNIGPATATATVTQVTLPAGLTYASSSRAGTVAGSVVSFPSLATLALNATVVDTITVNVTIAGSKLVIASSTATSSDSLAANHNGTLAAARVTTSAIALTVTVRSVMSTPVNRLPSSGYTADYVVRNTSVVSAQFGISAAPGAPGGFLTASAVSGTGLAASGTTGLVTLAANDSVTITVDYSVATGSAATDSLRLTVTSTLVSSVDANAVALVRRAVPYMMIARATDRPTAAPGEDVLYTIETQNIGENLARTVQVTDSLGAPLQFKVASVDNTMLGGLNATVEYSTDGVDWSYVPASGACSAPNGYDGCVRWIRWNITEDVLATAAATRAGVFRYSARIR